MRRKRKKQHLTLRIALFVIIFMTIVSIGYSYLSLSLKIKGQIIGQINEEQYTLAPNSDPNLSIVVSKKAEWLENNIYNYQYVFRITNVGSSIINAFKVDVGFAMKFDNIIITGYDSQIKGKNITITNNNKSLSSGESLVIDFTIKSTVSGQKINTIYLESLSSSDEVTLSDFPVIFSIVNEWGQYTYQYNVTVTNNTGSKLNEWQLDITLPIGTTFDMATGVTSNINNNILTIKSSTNNSRLNKSQSATFGLQLTTNIINFVPSNIKVTVR